MQDQISFPTDDAKARDAITLSPFSMTLDRQLPKVRASISYFRKYSRYVSALVLSSRFKGGKK